MIAQRSDAPPCCLSIHRDSDGMFVAMGYSKVARMTRVECRVSPSFTDPVEVLHRYGELRAWQAEGWQR